MTSCKRLARTLTFDQTYSVFYFHPKVLAEIESWSVDLLADYARLVELLMVHGPDLRLPHSRAFGDGLFELRPKGKDGISRAFYSFKAGRNIFILHAFVKKTQQTPDKDLAIARQRLKALRHD